MCWLDLNSICPEFTGVTHCNSSGNEWFNLSGCQSSKKIGEALRAFPDFYRWTDNPENINHRLTLSGYVNHRKRSTKPCGHSSTFIDELTIRKRSNPDCIQWPTTEISGQTGISESNTIQTMVIPIISMGLWEHQRTELVGTLRTLHYRKDQYECMYCNKLHPSKDKERWTVECSAKYGQCVECKRTAIPKISLPRWSTCGHTVCKKVTNS